MWGRYGRTTKPRRAECRRPANFRRVVCALSGSLHRSLRTPRLGSSLPSRIQPPPGPHRSWRVPTTAPAAKPTLAPPEVLEPSWREFRVAHDVLDVALAEVSLQGACRVGNQACRSMLRVRFESQLGRRHRRASLSGQSPARKRCAAA